MITGNIEIDDELDNDGEARLDVDIYGESMTVFIKKIEAIKMVEHLAKLFNIDNGEKPEPQLYTFGESSTEIHDEENSPFKRIKGNE